MKIGVICTEQEAHEKQRNQQYCRGMLQTLERARRRQDKDRGTSEGTDDRAEGGVIDSNT